MPNELTVFTKYLNSTGKEKASELYYKLLSKFSKSYSLADFTVLDVEVYISNLPPRTANAVIAAVKKFCWWKAQQDDYTKWSRIKDGLTDIRKKIPMVIQKEALTMPEVETLLSEITEPNLLNSVILLFYFGWRPVELTDRLAHGNIDKKNQTVKIIGAKTKDERIVPYADWIEPVLIDWREFSKKLVRRNKQPELWIRNMLNRRYKHGSISIQMTPRMARKTFQTFMRKSNIEEWKIDYLLGHKTGIPGVYTDWSMMVEDLRPVMDDYHYAQYILKEFV